MREFSYERFTSSLPRDSGRVASIQVAAEPSGFHGGTVPIANVLFASYIHQPPTSPSRPNLPNNAYSSSMKKNHITNCHDRIAPYLVPGRKYTSPEFDASCGPPFPRLLLHLELKRRTFPYRYEERYKMQSRPIVFDVDSALAVPHKPARSCACT